MPALTHSLASSRANASRSTTWSSRPGLATPACRRSMGTSGNRESTICLLEPLSSLVDRLGYTGLLIFRQASAQGAPREHQLSRWLPLALWAVHGLGST